MRRTLFVMGLLLLLVRLKLEGQTKPALTWQQVRERFETNNPALLADKLTIDESKAQEITAFLRPNPTVDLTVDGTQIAPTTAPGSRLSARLNRPASATWLSAATSVT